MTVLQNGSKQAHGALKLVVDLIRNDVPFEEITPDNVDNYM
jgi:hypothetical protein